MFGADLLVAPVLQPSKTTKSVFLPVEEEWIHVWSGTKYLTSFDQPLIEVVSEVGNIPVFYRASSKFAALFEGLKNMKEQNDFEEMCVGDNPTTDAPNTNAPTTDSSTIFTFSILTFLLICL